MELKSVSRTELRLWLADELRHLRGERSRKDAAARIGTHVSQIGHLETGRNKPNKVSIEALLELYDVSHEVDRLCAIRDAIPRATDWWADDADLLQSPFEAWLGLESVAAELHTFDSHVIPTLLQVAPYAEAVLRARYRPAEEQLQRLVDLDMRRRHMQEQRDEPAELLAIIDEQVLHRLVGDVEVMREQLTHLAHAAAQPHLTLRILPRERGLANSVDASFGIATMPKHFGHHAGGAFAPSLLHRGWLQDPKDKDAKAIQQGACYRLRKEVETYRAAWERLRERTVDPQRSLDLVEQAARDW